MTSSRLEFAEELARLAANPQPVRETPLRKHKRRAAVCAVLRAKPRPELLFIQRAAAAGDRWSGHVAFPGGRAEEGETDLEAAVREAREEAGLHLDDPGLYRVVARLDDVPVMALSETASLVVAVFVFVQLADEAPPLALSRKEVAAAAWVPLDSLALQPRPWLHVRMPVLSWGPARVEMHEEVAPPAGRATPVRYPPPLSESLRRAWWATRAAARRVRLPGQLRFPALNLRGTRLVPDGPAREDGTQPVREEEGDSSPSADDPAAFVVWGLTLGFTASLLSMLGDPSLRAEYDLHMVPARRLLSVKGRLEQLAELAREGWALRSKI